MKLGHYNTQGSLRSTTRHDRFCEMFCHHQFPDDFKEKVQLMRRPCVMGCQRSYSQGGMNACECQPTGARDNCHNFIDPGIDDWEESCDSHPDFAEDPKRIEACTNGWHCGMVMSGCVDSKTLSMTLPKEDIQKYCVR